MHKIHWTTGSKIIHNRQIKTGFKRMHKIHFLSNNSLKVQYSLAESEGERKCF